MFRDEIDIEFPNQDVPLDFTRHYSSQSPYGGPTGFGLGWIHSFGDRLVSKYLGNGAYELYWLTGSGVRYTFASNGAGWTSPPELHGELIELADSYIYRDSSGLEHHFEKTVFAATQEAGGFIQNYVGRLSRIQHSPDAPTPGGGVEVLYDGTPYDTTEQGMLRLQVNEVRSLSNPNNRLKLNYTDYRITSIDKWVDGVNVGTWTYNIDYGSHLFYNRLVGVTNPAGDTVQFDYAPGGSQNSQISRIIEADGAYHDYEYYPNGRTFRVTEGVTDGTTFTPQSSHSFNYNLFTETTEFIDENGNVTTYVHQEDGRLVRHIHPDRSRIITDWGIDDGAGGTVTDTETLMTRRVDEVGAVETYSYFTGLTGSDAFKNRRLSESTRSVGGGRPDVATAYDYSQPTGSGVDHIVNLASVTVDDGGADPRATSYTYDTSGRLIGETDPAGQLTERTYNASGLLESITTPRGTQPVYDDNRSEAVEWAVLSDAFNVSSGSLTVQSLTDTPSVGIVADAIRIERIDTDGSPHVVRIIDDSDLGDGFSIYTTGPNPWQSGASNPPAYLGRQTVLYRTSASDEIWGQWTFEDLPAGTYRVATSWASWGGYDDSVEFRIHDAATVGGVYDSEVVDQSITPAAQPTRESFNDFRTHFSYNTLGLVTSTTVAGQVRSTQTYHHTGRPAVVTDATGVTTETAFDAVGRAISVRQRGDAVTTADDLTVTNEYDERGRVTKSTDALGRVTEFEYDRRGDLVKTTRPGGGVVRHEYDPVGNRIASIDPLGRVTRFVYDAQDRLIQVTHPDGATESTRYDGVGRVVERTDALGRVSRFEYDDRGMRVKSTLAVGAGADEAITERKYNEFGELIESADAEGNVTQFFYDKLGRIVKTMLLADADAAGFNASAASYTAVAARPVSVVTTRYDRNGNVTETIVYDTQAGSSKVPTAQLQAIGLHDWVTDPTNQAALDSTAYLQTGYAYDHLNRQTSVTLPDGSTTSTVYDGADRIHSSTDERGAETTFSYDDYGRLEQTTLPDPDGAGPLASPVAQTVYDAVGNVIETIDPLNRSTRFTYDALNRVVATTDAELATTESVYDIAGQMVATINAHGVAVATKYDDRGRVAQRTWVDPDGAGPLTAPTETSEYDAAGNLIATTDVRGHTTKFAYDALNRLVEQRTPRTEYAGGAVVRIGTIDSNGDSPDDAIATFSYDDNGARTQSIDARGFATDYAYDEAGRLATQTLADADGAGGVDRLELVTLYDGYGNVIRTISQTQGGGAVHREDAFTFDQRNRLTSEIFNATAAVGDADRVQADYGYDATGNLLFVTTAAATAGIGATTRYEYDLLGRQTAERIDAPTVGDAGRRSTESTYDAAGNVVTQTSTIREGVASSATDRSTVTQYAYDNVDRLTTLTADAGGIAAVSQTTYDDLGRVTTEQDTTGVTTAHTYDDLNRIVTTAQQDPTPSDGTPSLLVEQFAYDAADNLTSYTNGEGDMTTYEYDVAGRTLHEETIIADGPDVTTAYAYDESGNRTALTDGSGNTTTFVYDGWDRVTSEVQGAVAGTDPTRSYAYDVEGDLVTYTDRNGRVIRYSYDDASRVVREEWFADASDTTRDNALVLAYDKLGRLVAQGQDYDSAGIPSDVYVDRYAESFVYDTLDRLTTRRNYLPSGGVDFDAMGVNVDGFRFNPLLDQHYAYDQLAGLSGSELTAYRYSQTFEKTSANVSSRDFDDVYAETLISSDALGRTVGLEESSRSFAKGVAGATVSVRGKAIDFGYDDAGRMTDVSRTADNDADGLLDDFRFETGYAYDPAGRLEQITHTRTDTDQTFATHAYTYDNASRIATTTGTVVGNNLQLTRSELFTYDQSGRLTDWDYTLTDNNAAYVVPGGGTRDLTLSDGSADEAHTFDGAGNRTETGYATGGFNRVSADGDHQYVYDAEGNVTEKRSADGTTLEERYVWDHRNRLVRVERAQDTASPYNVEYAYNNDDLRITKVVYTGDPANAASIAISQVEFYAYDGGQLAAVIDGSWSGSSIYSNGSYQRRVQNTPGAVDQALFEESFRATPGAAADALYWAATDRNGSVRDLLANDHSLTNHAEFSAHGERLSLLDDQKQDVAEAAVDAAFAGREWDSDVELSYNRARWMDPTQGRFLGEDPSGFAAGDQNLYRYAAGNPVMYTDPSGLVTFDPVFDTTSLIGGTSTPLSSIPGFDAQAAINSLSSGSRGSFANRTTYVSPVSSGAGGSESLIASSDVSSYFQPTTMPVDTSIPRCISCHNPIIMNGGSVGDLPESFQVSISRWLGTTDPQQMDAMIGGLRDVGRTTRAVVAGAGGIATAGAPLAPLGTLGLSTVIGAGMGAVEYASTGSVAAALDQLPLLGLRNAPQQVRTIVSAGATLSQRALAAVNLSSNILETLPVAKAFVGGVGSAYTQGLRAGGVAPTRTGSFGGVTGTTAAERSFLSNAQATFGDGSVFTSATRHRGNLVIQRSDIPLSIQNLRRMQSGNSPFVRNAAGEWETLNLHHVGRRDGKLIEVFNSHNTYNPATGGALHIPGLGGPVRQPGVPQTYWQQRLDDFIGSGQISDDLLSQLGR